MSEGAISIYHQFVVVDWPRRRLIRWLRCPLSNDVERDDLAVQRIIARLTAIYPQYSTSTRIEPDEDVRGHYPDLDGCFEGARPEDAAVLETGSCPRNCAPKLDTTSFEAHFDALTASIPLRREAALSCLPLLARELAETLEILGAYATPTDDGLELTLLSSAAERSRVREIAVSFAVEAMLAFPPVCIEARIAVPDTDGFEVASNAVWLKKPS